MGTSLAVLWLGLCVFSAGAQVQSLPGEPRLHKPHHAIKKKKKKGSRKSMDLTSESRVDFLSMKDVGQLMQPPWGLSFLICKREVNRHKASSTEAH